MFSRRTSFDTEESLYAAALHEARTGGREVVDLTVSNPGQCGLGPHGESTLAALNHAAAMEYQPDPRGLLSARRAVSAYYGNAVLPEQIVLTAGTSEAYSYLFRLLCDPEDEVLVPQPGYPLFDMLAAFDNVQLRTYPLLYDHGWQIHVDALRSAITAKTRAILLVHPNNPTGHFTSAEEKAALQQLAAEHDLALIVDEVFLDYGIDCGIETESKGDSFAGPDASVLTFVLSGLSKVCALPQMKVAWTVVCGPAVQVKEALGRFDLLADTFLSVSTPSQLALPVWMEDRDAVQAAILGRVRGNLKRLDALIQESVISRLRVDAGWAVVLRVPAVENDLSLTARLIREAGVAVHPGSFYGFPSKGWLVLSLLLPEAVFERGVNRLLTGIKDVNPA